MTGYDDMVEAFKDTVRSDYNCYKLFGADVILDANLKPWVLEFNDFPSLEPHVLDRHVNEPMIAEMFNIVGFGLPESISERKKENLAEQYCLDHNYSQTFLSLNRFDVCNMEMTEFQHSNFSQQTLEGVHLRLVLKAEEELGCSQHFQRLFPLRNGQKYLKYSQIK